MCFDVGLRAPLSGEQTCPAITLFSTIRELCLRRGSARVLGCGLRCRHGERGWRCGWVLRQGVGGMGGGSGRLAPSAPNGGIELRFMGRFLSCLNPRPNRRVGTCPKQQFAVCADEPGRTHGPPRPRLLIQSCPMTHEASLTTGIRPRSFAARTEGGRWCSRYVPPVLRAFGCTTNPVFVSSGK